MSGIVGVVDFSGRPVARETLEAMTSEMAFRGPDGISHWHNHNLGLGQCMFHTTPESLDAVLPLHSQDGRHVLVMDGRVDNREEVTARIVHKGGRLRNLSDAEIVLVAYEIWGEHCLSEMDGDFAIAIWDARKRQLFCGRDRLGFKPFHYHWDGKRFVFASDIAAVLKFPGIEVEIDETMVAQVICDKFICQEQTIWRGIKRLPTANYAVVSDLGLRKGTYWTPDLSKRITYRKQEEYVEHYRDLLFDEVRRASRTIGPVGCEVSGGLDSSAVFAVADRLEKKGELTDRGLFGYTLEFAAGSPREDLACARAVAAHLDRTIKEVRPALPTLDWFAEFVNRHKTIAPRPNASMHNSIYEEAIADSCRTVLTGIGGDEWLNAGTPFAAAELLTHGDFAQLYHYLVSQRQGRSLRPVAHELMRFGIYPLVPSRLRKRVRRILDIADHAKTEETLLSPRLHEQLAVLRERGANAKNAGGLSHKSRFHDYHLAVLGEAVLITAKETTELLASLSVIELRAPLSSRRMIEYCFAVPLARRNWSATNRSIHRSAIAGIVPKAVLQRQTKSLFDGPCRSYSPLLTRKSDWQSFVLTRGWVDPEKLKQAAHDAGEGCKDFAPHNDLWLAYTCGLLGNLI